MNVFKSKFEQIFYEASKQYFNDYYSGKIKATCDEDCKDDCNIDHGFIELPIEYSPIFKTDG